MIIRTLTTLLVTTSILKRNDTWILQLLHLNGKAQDIGRAKPELTFLIVISRKLGVHSRYLYELFKSRCIFVYK